MKINDLRTFLDVVDAGGMTQAALRRGSTQPGISRTVRDLELRMQAPLLRRTGRGVELTQAGEVFARFARTTLEAYAETRAATRKLADARPRRLTFATPGRLERLILPELHRRFAVALPDLAFDVVEAGLDGMADGLSSGRFDLALSYRREDGGEALDRAAFRESLYAVGMPALLDDDSAPLPLADLADRPLLLPGDSPYRRRIDRAFASIGIGPKVTRRLDSSAAMLAFAGEGEGIAILPYSNVYAECDRGEVVARLIVSPTIDRGLYLHAARHLENRFARQVRAVARESLAALAGRARWRRPVRD